MNVIEQAHQAYAPNRGAVRTDRSVESQLISGITSRLRSASEDKGAGFPKLMAALHENRRMWTALAADVADTDNKLPKELRAQIFYLAEFTEIHSKQVVQGTANVQALVDINIAIMRGLNGHGAS